jgi:hypothetical protein
MSPEGKQWLVGINTALGAGIGNPHVRSRMFFKPKSYTSRSAVGGLAPVTKTAPAFRPYRALGTASVAAGAPKYVNMMDWVSRGGRLAQKGIGSEDVQKLLTDPGGYAKEYVGRGAKELGESPASRAFAGGLANTLAGGIGGSMVGGAGGTLAGHLLAGDDETLDYKTRRRREMIRNVLGLGGTIAGGIAAPILLSKYAPNLIPSFTDKLVAPANSTTQLVTPKA